MTLREIARLVAEIATIGGGLTLVVLASQRDPTAALIAGLVTVGGAIAQRQLR